MVFIYGGAFEFGSTQDINATDFIDSSVAHGKPVVFVTANQRGGGFGFLPGKGPLPADVANLGLRDRKLALEWVSDNIQAFGGDPKRVTLWGQSAGAVSMSDQMLLYR